jgi:hypothetical protein
MVGIPREKDVAFPWLISPSVVMLDIFAHRRNPVMRQRLGERITIA